MGSVGLNNQTEHTEPGGKVMREMGRDYRGGNERWIICVYEILKQ